MTARLLHKLVHLILVLLGIEPPRCRRYGVASGIKITVKR